MSNQCDRLYLYVPAVDLEEPTPYKDSVKQKTTKVPEEKANLISSECADGLHAPVLDIDLPINVLPSSQLGHYHLYIDKKMSWEDYTILLKALAACGVVEKGFVDAALDKGYTAVRKPGVQKPGTGSVGAILQENAHLKAELHKARKENQELQEKYNLLSNEVVQAQAASWV